MKNSLDVFKTSRKAEQQGVWIPVNDAGFEVRVARIGNPDYLAFIRERTQTAKSMKLLAAARGDKVYEDVVKEAVSKHILLDWKHLLVDGQEVPYTNEKALEFFNSHPEFYNLVMSLASDIENFRNDEWEQKSGN